MNASAPPLAFVSKRMDCITIKGILHCCMHSARCWVATAAEEGERASKTAVTGVPGPETVRTSFLRFPITK
jgi:hypothetical protein